MSTYEIMKAEMTKDSRPGTMGRNMDINACCDLFVKIMNNLVDKDESVASMNTDNEVRTAILNRKGIDDLRAAGVLS
jgi:hypothetical protein